MPHHSLTLVAAFNASLQWQAEARNAFRPKMLARLYLQDGLRSSNPQGFQVVPDQLWLVQGARAHGGVYFNSTALCRWL